MISKVAVEFRARLFDVLLGLFERVKLNMLSVSVERDSSDISSLTTGPHARSYPLDPCSVVATSSVHRVLLVSAVSKIAPPIVIGITIDVINKHWPLSSHIEVRRPVSCYRSIGESNSSVPVGIDPVATLSNYAGIVSAKAGESSERPSFWVITVEFLERLKRYVWVFCWSHSEAPCWCKPNYTTGRAL